MGKNNHLTVERLGAPTRVPGRSGYVGKSLGGCRWYSQPASPWPRWQWLQWCRLCRAAPPGWTLSGPASWTPRLRRTKGRQRGMTEPAGATTLCSYSLCVSIIQKHGKLSDMGSLGSETMLTCPNSMTWDYPTAESTEELPAALRTGTELSPDTYKLCGQEELSSSPRFSPGKWGRWKRSVVLMSRMGKGAQAVWKQNRLWCIT